MVQANNAPQASKTYGQIQDYLNKYTAYVGAAPGNIFFVDSGHANTSDYNDGLSKDTPREQIESCFTAATVLVTENNGDIIFAMPGHEETIDAAGDLDLDIAGVTIVFLGEGEAQAKITLGTTSTADMDIDAANITLIRPKFVAEFDALAGSVDINAADFTIVDGQYRDGTSIDTTDCIVAGTSATRLRIHGWKYLPGNEAGTEKESNIFLDGVDDAELFDIYIKGAFNAACIEVGTDEILNVHMKDIVLNNTDTDPSPGMLLDSNCDGMAQRVLIRVASGSAYVSDISDINWYESYGTGTDGNTLDDPIGTAGVTGLEGLIGAADATQTDNLHGKLGTDTQMNDISIFDMLGSGLQTLDLATSVGWNADSASTTNLHGKLGTDAEMGDTSIFDMLGSGAQTLDLATSVGFNVDSASTTNLHGKLGTDAEMGDTSIFDMLGSGAQTLDLATSVGWNADSASTTNLHGKIGTDAEMGDTSIFDMLGSGAQTLALATSVGFNVDSASTTNLHGKIGTDAEMGDTSIFDMLGSGAQTLDLATSVGWNADSASTTNLHGKIGTDAEMGDTSIFDMLGSGAQTLDLATSVGWNADSASTTNLHGKIGTDAEMGDTSIFDMLGSGAQTLALATSVGWNADSASTTNLHGKIGTDTEMGDTSIFDMLGSGAQTLALATSVGFNVDSASTTNLHGKIGTDAEMGDTSIFDMLGSGAQTLDLATSVGWNADSASTTNLHGKIGTDTEMGDISIFDMLGGAAAKSTPLIDGIGGWLSTTIAFATTAVSTLNVFNVTGDVLVRAIGMVATTLASSGNTGTVELGVVDSTDILLPQIVATGALLVAGDVWADASSDKKAGAMPDDSSWVGIGGGNNIWCTVGANTLLSGDVDVYLQWMPLSVDGAITAA